MLRSTLSRLSTEFLLRLPPLVVEEPYQTWLNVIAILAGISDLFTIGRSAPPSLVRVVPPAILLAWGIFLVVGGTTNMVGLLLRGTRWDRYAPGIERAGSNLLGPAAIAYSFVLYLVVHAWYAGSLTLVFGIGVLIRGAVLRPKTYALILRREVERQAKRVVDGDS